MKALERMSIKTARRIAEKLQPEFFHEISSVWDFPCTITDRRSFEFEPRPPLYYSVREDDVYWYVAYCFYHRYDPAGRHEHDFQGVLMQKHKTHDVKYRFAMVQHHFLAFGERIPQIRPGFVVRAGSHAIHNDFTPRQSLMEYADYTLVDMDTNNFDREWVMEVFGDTGPKLPEQWIDVRLRAYIRKRKPTIKGVKITKMEGLFLHRPDLLFALAEKRGCFK